MSSFVLPRTAQSSTALATAPAKRRGRGRFWFHAKTGVRLYPLEKVPEAVARVVGHRSNGSGFRTPRRSPSRSTPPLYVAKRKGASRMDEVQERRFGAKVP